MYSQTQTPFDSSKNTGPPKGITAFLLGIVVCYQLVNRLFTNTALSNDDNELDDSEITNALSRDDSEGACAAVPGTGAASSLCMEAKLFRGWRELPTESHDELDSLLAISPTKQQPAAAPATSPSAPAAPKPVPRMRGAAKAPERPSTPAPKKHFAEDHWATDLSELQQKLEAKMQSQARRHAEHRALRALHETAHVASVQAADDGMTAWAHNLDDLTHEMHDHMKNRRKARIQHAAEHAAAHAAHAAASLHKQPEPEAHPLLDEVQSLGFQMCKDPERRNRPSCAQFLHLHPSEDDHVHHKDRHESAKDRQADTMAHMKLLEKHIAELHTEQAHDSEEIQKQSTQFLRDLCADPARSSYPACAQLLATSRPAEAAAPTGSTRAAKGLRGDASRSHEVHRLHWAAIGDRKPTGHAGSAAQLVLQRKELRGAHWEGRFPKVACITMLPKGHTTETLMRYFMDNYKLQHYDGERRLVLVYHDADREASRVAHLYADGTSIIASPARGGGTGDFPSATAWRYGAWLAHDAELIARWDFDAFHHPNRLSMQVRSIAMADRPASLVPRITSFDEEGKSSTVSGGAGPHGSMVGDAAWMQQHWMPLLEEETAVVHGIQASNIVQVDMSELLAYHDVPVSSK